VKWHTITVADWHCWSDWRVVEFLLHKVIESHLAWPVINPLTGTLKPQSNGPLYSNTMIGTLAIDGWARGPAQAPPRCTKCNSPRISGQCTNFILFDMALKPQSNGPLFSYTWLVHWPLMRGLLHLVQRGGARAGCGPAQSPPHCTKCNSHPSTASVPTSYYSMWHYNCICILKRVRSVNVATS